MSSTSSFNYAKFFGIHSIAAAIIFAIAYVPLLAYFIFQSFRRPTYVFFMLCVFCTVRIVGFVIRAILASSESAGESLGLFIADQTLFGVGFFGLLYSAYTLVLDRELIADIPLPQGPISQITRNRRLFRLIMLVAVVIGIIGSTTGTSSDSSQSSKDLGHTLRVVSTIIFLVLTVLQAYRTILFALAEIRALTPYKRNNESFGMRHGVRVLCIISVLLLIREVYSLVAVFKQSLSYNEQLWYPLAVLPELVAAGLYATPDLVPPRSELRERPYATELPQYRS